jgi:uncharacterized membrane protein
MGDVHQRLVAAEGEDMTGWALWLLTIIVSFALFEGYALKTGHMTLSRWVWTISKAFPLFPWLAGVLTGVLATHFFWGGITCFSPVQ